MMTTVEPFDLQIVALVLIVAAAAAADALTVDVVASVFAGELVLALIGSFFPLRACDWRSGLTEAWRASARMSASVHLCSPEEVKQLPVVASFVACDC